MGPIKINRKQLFVGLLFLSAGTLEYLTTRPIGSTYFLSPLTDLHANFLGLPDLYGNLGYFAPDFFHPLALSLITMAFFSAKRSVSLICFLYLFIDSILETSQFYGSKLVEFIPNWFDTIPVLENFKAFFINGTFDFCDLVAIILGSVTAFFIGNLLSKERGGNERKRHYRKSLES